MSLDFLNIILFIGFIGMTAAGIYSVWQSFQLEVNHKEHGLHHH